MRDSSPPPLRDSWSSSCRNTTPRQQYEATDTASDDEHVVLVDFESLNRAMERFEAPRNLASDKDTSRVRPSHPSETPIRKPNPNMGASEAQEFVFPDKTVSDTQNGTGEGLGKTGKVVDGVDGMKRVALKADRRQHATPGRPEHSTSMHGPTLKRKITRDSPQSPEKRQRRTKLLGVAPQAPASSPAVQESSPDLGHPENMPDAGSTERGGEERGGEEPRTPAKQSTMANGDTRRDSPGALSTYPDVSLITSPDSSKFSPRTVPIPGETLATMAALMGTRSWTNAGIGWDDRFFEQDAERRVHDGANTGDGGGGPGAKEDVFDRLVQRLKHMARICRDIPRSPGSREQFMHLAGCEAIMRNHILAVDDLLVQVARAVEGKPPQDHCHGGNVSSTSETRRRYVTVMSRRVIPATVVLLALVYLSGAAATGGKEEDAGLGSRLPAEARHTQQTLQLLRRVLSWLHRLDVAMLVAATDAEAEAERQPREDNQEMSAEAMTGRKKLQGMIRQLDETLEEGYRAISRDAWEDINLQHTVETNERKFQRRSTDVRRVDETKTAPRPLEVMDVKEEEEEKDIRAERITARGRQKDARRSRKAMLQFQRFKESVMQYTQGRSDDSPGETWSRTSHNDGPGEDGTEAGKEAESYPEEVMSRVLRVLRFSPRPDPKLMAWSLGYAEAQIWDMIGLVRTAAMDAEERGGRRMPEELLRAFTVLYGEGWR